MGYLHNGHLSLVKESKKNCDVTVVSIFVNPTQFAPSEDFDSYPRDLEKDIKLLLDEHVDYLFLPAEKEIYSQDFQTYVNVEYISRSLEGEFRPTHFRGVATVVLILFNCVQPDYAYFGQKDAQQVAVIKQMVNDLKVNTNIITCLIIRESDGLAMSSRNVYLTAAERNDALVLYKSLKMAEKIIAAGERKVNLILSEITELISSVPTAELDYVRIVEAGSFEVVDDLKTDFEHYILIACKIGKTRLIDNLKIKL